MFLRRTTRVLTSWIGVLAILMAALAPSISYALNVKSRAFWTEICTSVGAVRVQPDGGSADHVPPSGDVHLLEHCPYCSLHANAIAMPVDSAGVAIDRFLAHLRPAAFLAAPRTLHAWISAQPRAPPQIA